MSYLDDLPRYATTPNGERRLLRQAIQNSRLLDFLRRQGYQILAMETGYWVTELDTADMYLRNPRSLSEFEVMLLGSTQLGHLVRATTRVSGYENHRRQVRFVLEQLSAIPKYNSPKFVFMHAVCPHPPFVFGPQGEPISPRGHPRYFGDGMHFHSATEYRQGYTAQLQFINGQITTILRSILQQSPSPPIIIVQGDHGPGMTWDPSSLERTNIRERFSILNAYRFPDGNYEQLDSRITPVNSFRVVLNTFFGTELERLPERSFYSTWEAPLQFVDITKRLVESEPAR